jgi:hypothetical protein
LKRDPVIQKSKYKLEIMYNVVVVVVVVAAAAGAIQYY